MAGGRDALGDFPRCLKTLPRSRESITSTESVNVVGGNDACFAALQRLKHESSMHPIKNVSPLGKAIITSDGAHVPSQLTRTVIDDAITIRLWIIDLTQAKLLRERSSFIEVSLFSIPLFSFV